MRTRIVYEDQDILVCYKPAGLAAQAGAVTQPDVVSELKSYLKGAYVGVVHRLDQPVEGLLVFARSKRVAAALSCQLEDGTLRKQYCALVCGRPLRDEGELVNYLCKEGSLSKVVCEGTAGAKKAVLQYEVTRQFVPKEADGTQECTCLDIRIDTGRFHQIRCQLSHAGMPILGDQKYGTAESLELSRRLGIQHTALCAYRIQLKHPVSGGEISCEICPDWAEQG